MDTRVVSVSQLVGIMLLGTFSCMFLCGHRFSPGSVLLGVALPSGRDTCSLCFAFGGPANLLSKVATPFLHPLQQHGQAPVSARFHPPLLLFYPF